MEADVSSRAAACSEAPPAKDCPEEDTWLHRSKGAITERWRHITVLAISNKITEEYLVTAIDIDEKKKVEDVLRFVEYGIKRSKTPTFWTRETGDFVYINDAVLLHLGYTKEEFENLHPWELATFLCKEEWPAFF